MKKTMKKGSSLIEKIKAEQERIKTKKESYGSYEKIEFFKPSEGDNTIRILPAKGADDLPFRTIKLHYISVKKKDGTLAHGIPVRCLHDLGKDECPLCDAAKELYSGNEKDKEKAKQMTAKEVNIYNVIDYKTRKVMPYSCGITVHEEIINYLGEHGEELFDLDNGRNWKIVKKVDPRKPKNLGIKYSVRVDIKDSAVPTKLRPLLENAVDLDSLYQEADMKAINSYLGYLGFDEAEVDEDEEEAPKKKASAPIAKKASKHIEEEDEDDFEEEDEKPKKASKHVEEDDEDEEEEDFDIDEEEEEEEKPKKSAKAIASPSKAKKAIKYVEEDEEEEEDFEEDDDDFEDFEKELGL
jgi:hypothetical protein